MKNAFLLLTFLLSFTASAEVGTTSVKCQGALLIRRTGAPYTKSFIVSAFAPKYPTRYVSAPSNGTESASRSGQVEFFIRHDYFAPFKGGNGVGLNAGKGSFAYDYDLASSGTGFSFSGLKFNFDVVDEGAPKGETIAIFEATKMEAFGLGFTTSGTYSGGSLRNFGAGTFTLSLACE